MKAAVCGMSADASVFLVFTSGVAMNSFEHDVELLDLRSVILLDGLHRATSKKD